VNRLVEGTNKLLGILKRLCAPDLGEDEYALITDFTHLPRNWLDHLDEVLNKRILCSLQFSPNELALGLIVNTNWTEAELAATEPSLEEADMHMAYVEQQNLNGYAQIVLHENRRKAIFDKQVLKTHPKEVIFKLGDLVQVHRTDLTFTHSNDQKLTPIPHYSTHPKCVQIANIERIPSQRGIQCAKTSAFLPTRGNTIGS